jgi:transposase
MQLHGNAALSVKKRLVLCRRVVDERWTLTKAAAAAEVSVRTARKWVRRYRAEGEPGLADRSSVPRRQPTRTSEARVQAIAALRRLRMTGAQIAEVLSMPLSTVSGVLTRIGLGKLSRLEPPEPPNRYERRHPGELIHIDVKSSGASIAAPGTGCSDAVPAGMAARAARAGSSSTSASTTPPAWPTSKSSATSRR